MVQLSAIMSFISSDLALTDMHNTSGPSVLNISDKKYLKLGAMDFTQPPMTTMCFALPTYVPFPSSISRLSSKMLPVLAEKKTTPWVIVVRD